MDTDSDNAEIIVSRKRCCMCRSQEKKRVNWDLLIMILAIWNCIQVPYDIAFNPDSDPGPVEYALNQIVDMIFIIDVFVTFRTTYINEETGIEIYKPTKIAIQYFKGRFWIDLLASIPTDLLTLMFVGSSSGKASNATIVFNMFNLLKLIRVARLSRLIAYLNLKSNIKMALKLAKLLFFLILYLH